MLRGNHPSSCASPKSRRRRPPSRPATPAAPAPITAQRSSTSRPISSIQDRTPTIGPSTSGNASPWGPGSGKPTGLSWGHRKVLDAGLGATRAGGETSDEGGYGPDGPLNDLHHDEGRPTGSTITATNGQANDGKRSAGPRRLHIVLDDGAIVIPSCPMGGELRHREGHQPKREVEERRQHGLAEQATVDLEQQIPPDRINRACGEEHHTAGEKSHQEVGAGRRHPPALAPRVDVRGRSA